jgi:hypothetical protein
VALGQDRPGVTALGRSAKHTARRVRSATQSRSQAARRPPRCSSRDLTNAARRVAARRDKPTKVPATPALCPPACARIAATICGGTASRSCNVVEIGHRKSCSTHGVIAAPLATILRRTAASKWSSSGTPRAPTSRTQTHFPVAPARSGAQRHNCPLAALDHR